MIKFNKLLLSFLFLSSIGSLWAMEGESERDSDKSGEISQRSEHQCAICGEACKETARVTGRQLFGCDERHEFCLDCMINWLKTCASSGNIASCPNCRSQLRCRIENISPLVIAAIEKYRNVFPLLIEYAFNGDMGGIDSLLSDPNIDVNVHMNDTPLIAAASNGHRAVVERLLKDKRIDVRLRNNDGCTALMVAARNGHELVVDCLLKDGRSDVNVCNNNGLAAVMLAAQNGHDAVLARLLSDHRVDVNKMTPHGASALMIASFRGQLSSVQLLLKNDRLDFKVSCGLRACELAAGARHTGVVWELLPRITEEYAEYGWTRLMIVARVRCGEIFDDLLSHSDYAEVNAQDYAGMTALMTAAFFGRLSLIKALLQSPLLDFSKNENGFRAYQIAEQKGYVEIANELSARILVERHGWSRLMSASYLGNSDAVQDLLPQLSDEAVHIQDNEGSTALMIAVRRGHLPIVQLLLQDVRFDFKKNDEVLSALKIAEAKGYSAIAHELLDKAFLEYSDRGWSKLMIASHCGLFRLVEGLSISEEINGADNSGYTALMHAAFSGQSWVAQTLLNNPVLDFKKDFNGLRACQLAYNAGCHDVLQKLLDRAVLEYGDSTLIIACRLGLGSIISQLYLKNSYSSEYPLERDTLMAPREVWHQKVEELLHEAEVDFKKNGSGLKACKLAYCFSMRDKVDELLNRAVLEYRDKGWSKLMIASQLGLGGLIRELLNEASSEEINRRDVDGRTALALAIRTNFKDACFWPFIKELLEKMDDEGINAQDKDGRTALMEATSRGLPLVVQELLKKMSGDGINAQDCNGNTAFILAAQGNCQPLVELIWNNSGFDFMKNENGLRAYELTQSGSMRDLLIKRAFGECRKKGYSKLMLAARIGYVGQYVRSKIMSAEKINEQDADGRTALVVAIKNNHLLFVQNILKNQNIDINLSDHRGWTSLMYAAYMGNEAMVQGLLDERILDFKVNDNGFGACKIAAQEGHAKIVDMLFDRALLEYRDKGWSKLMIAAQLGLKDIVFQLMHQMSFDEMNAEDTEGRTAAALAEQNGHREIVAMLSRHSGMRHGLPAEDGQIHSSKKRKH